MPIILKAFDGIISKFPLVLPKYLATDEYLKITYTNDAAAGNTVIWNVGYLWTGTVERGIVIDSFAALTNNSTGLTWDGTNLWNTNFVDDKMYKLNPATGAEISSFAGPSANPDDLAWDGTYLWSCDSATDTIYKMNATTGRLIFLGIIVFTLWFCYWNME